MYNELFIFDEKRLFDVFNRLNVYDEINLVWKGNNTIKGLCIASKSGHGSNLFDKLEPTSYIDFYDKLIKYSIDNSDKLSIYDRGLLYEELVNLANEFKNGVESLNNNIKFELCDYIDYIMYVNIIQTFDGHINEVMLVNYIKSKWYNDVHKVNGVLDSKYGIDILYRNDTRGIQVKSINFFFGNKSSLINDRKNLIKLSYEVKDKFNIDMYYAIYDRMEKKYLLSSNGTPIFSFNEFKEILENNKKIYKYKKIYV